MRETCGCGYATGGEAWSSRYGTEDGWCRAATAVDQGSGRAGIEGGEEDHEVDDDGLISTSFPPGQNLKYHGTFTQ